MDKCLATKKGYHDLSYSSLVILIAGSVTCLGFIVPILVTAPAQLVCHTPAGEDVSSYHQQQAYEEYAMANGKLVFYFALLLACLVLILMPSLWYQMSIDYQNRRMLRSHWNVSTWYVCLLLCRIMVLATSMALQWGYFFPVTFPTDHTYNMPAPAPNDQQVPHLAYNDTRAVNVTSTTPLTLKCKNNAADFQSGFGILLFVIHGLALVPSLIDIINLGYNVIKEGQEFLEDEKFCAEHITITGGHLINLSGLSHESHTGTKNLRETLLMQLRSRQSQSAGLGWLPLL